MQWLHKNPNGCPKKLAQHWGLPGGATGFDRWRCPGHEAEEFPDLDEGLELRDEAVEKLRKRQEEMEGERKD